MAVGHYQTNPNTPRGRALAESLAKLEDGRDELYQEIGTLIQMKDSGDLTAYAVGQYGFSDTTAAAAALSELESLKAALDGVAATMNQAFAKFRNG